MEINEASTSIADDFRSACETFDAWTVTDMPIGMVGIAGNSVDYSTGGWRNLRPIWNAAKCKQCMLCWVNCPDSSITVDAGKMTGIDLDHCKGCGICAVECRFDALAMVPEHGSADSAQSSAVGQPDTTKGA